ncbi:U-box domain-containing protein 52 [Vigna radiata var. radiata]|uniref:RING-type E3 ubiquitin transferase n=1 Tax=Vigna radiata var. radiata TaxID=3916 RepID=A0A1S3TZW6_VIGRR|nr:U-box domain-containing protein 52 [Vigna radiata var. radiata]XP_022636524.1 U-box domain-containing protein 52 [Vigna radiata var. radiata]
MWLPKHRSDKKDGVSGLVAVAIDKKKESQSALKWAVDNLLTRSATVILIHVKLLAPTLSPSPSLFAPRISSFLGDDTSVVSKEHEGQNRSVFLPYRVFCTRKDIQCKDVLLEDSEVPRAIIEYASQTGVEHLVLGSSAKTSFLKRFKVSDIPGEIAKGAPDFCTVYVIAKGKIQTMRSATRPAPAIFSNQLCQVNNGRSNLSEPNVYSARSIREQETYSFDAGSQYDETFRSPFTRKRYNGRQYGDTPNLDTDISFVSSGRRSTERLIPSLNLDTGISNSRLSYSSDTDANFSFESASYRRKSTEMGSPLELSSFSFESDKQSSCSSQTADELEAEMRRLKLELKQTMKMYNTACKEALTAQQKAVELQRWKIEEERRLEEARLAEEAALAIAEKEKAKSKAAIEAAEAQKRIAELEAQKRLSAEMKALKESEEKRKVLESLVNVDVRYRKYTIEEIEEATNFFSESLKIGEGGYGPVFKCLLDHTPVAVKVLRPDAQQGRSQFQREVEVLSCIRHPHMVLLLGACPEYGCLVYEYMANGSLEDRLFRQGNTPPLPWQLRFKIAAEIGTGLLFLHQTKPEPLVHRDLKPANILLDRNFVSKISDVGLARLVPPSVADSVTQYHMTSTAGTFCYIDPEYQQTGMLGVKSDIYSLGIIFLQILTAKSPMGLTHHVARAIEKGTLSEMLDPSLSDWPQEEALNFAKLGVQCAELRRRDRPDLGKVVLPELNRLRNLGEDTDLISALGNPTNMPRDRHVSAVLEGDCPPFPNAVSGEIRANNSVTF